ncbi:MAG: hypothetical protein GY711_17565 [bacterium]|nr:hypothetical protein [bacterium]
MVAAKRPRRRFSKWILRAGLVLGALGVVEIGFRVWLASRGDAYDSSAAESELRRRLRAFSGETFLERAQLENEDAEVDPGTTGRLPHPFTGWQTVRGAQELEERVRATRALPPDSYLIWIVGGSVAGIFGNPGSGVEPLTTHLAADPRFGGRKIVVHNYARAAYKQPQQVTLVTHLFSLGVRPDAVINIDGFNEVAIGSMNATNGSDPTYPDLTQWGALVLADSAAPELADARDALNAHIRRTRRFAGTVLGLRLHHSAAVGWWSTRLMAHWTWRTGKLETAYKETLLALATSATLRGPSGAGERDGLGAIVTNWTESSRSLHAICSARDVFYLHVLQPTLHDEGSKSLSQEEIDCSNVRDSWRRGARDGYPLLREAGDTLRASGVAFEDASRVFRDVSESLYYDACHFNRAGNLLLAERVADAFLLYAPE